MLRDEFISRIDTFGGIDNFTASLLACKRGGTCMDKVVFNRLASYFNHVYCFDVNVEERAIKHKKLTLWAVRFLGMKLEVKEIDVLRISRNLLKLKLSYAKGVEALY